MLSSLRFPYCITERELVSEEIPITIIEETPNAFAQLWEELA